MLQEDAGREDNNRERVPRLLRMLVFFSKYPEILAIILVALLALVSSMLAVFLQ
jgi:hypothetical protein